MPKSVIKRDGYVQHYKEEKIIRTAIRAGLSKRDAEAVARKVSASFKDKIQARELYKRVKQLIREYSPTACCKYQLKEAVAKIDPELFEIYIQRVLETNDFECVWNCLVQGEVIEHQIDVIASKDGVSWMVECKHHMSSHRDTGMGKVLQEYARIDDIRDGYKLKKNEFADARGWMINNTRFSNHAKRYAKAKGIRLTGWGSGTHPLQKLIEAKRCYPMTILDLAPKQLTRCNQADILTLCDFLAEERKAKEIFGNKYDEVMGIVLHLRGIAHH